MRWPSCCSPRFRRRHINCGTDRLHGRRQYGFDVGRRRAQRIGAPDAVTDGQPNLIRYVFDRPTGEFSPFTGISLEEGKLVVRFESFNLDATNVSLSILSTTNLLDWTHTVEFLFPDPPYDFNGLILPLPDASPTRFFKLQAQ